MSLLVDDATTYAALETLATDLKLADLEAVEHAATYRGKPLPAGKKSVTLTLSFRRPDATVPREHADAEVAKLVEAAKAKLAAEQRA